ncbi:ABC transporter permease [Nakamurella multipartita]|uniref:ABC3 transporter permease protein domain-containing protein n=1 Tax=Nakamurella multipartita (strain ATCC 700099 / DSM 44233 / CIP 104796 / JCM 9543 / NBRC 105858 / Y-104) TaxID=479431 RepID=C8XGC4_NAKMY|nr:ABC transporter permease [Nakamurella multipartita]ACV80126.1 protein of unknown function DUF214 [Nakamurella multipartita DSM 44233]
MTAQAPAHPPDASTATRSPGWVANLRLAAALLVAAGRAGRLRWLLVTIGLALCTLVLLLAASIGPALDSRDGRAAALSATSAPLDTTDASVDVARLAPTWFQVTETASVYRGDRVQVSELTALDPAVAAPPPGVDRFPRPGEVVVSPALADLLAGPEGDGFRPRLGGDTVVGTIADDGLLAPDELRLYRGVAADPSGWAVYRIAEGWGGGYVPTTGMGGSGVSLVAVLLTAGVTIVIVPLLLFVALMSRVGSPARDRRDAGLRLLGATTGQLRVVTVVETGTAALAGLLVGGAAFLLARPAAPFVAVGSTGFFPDDLRPSAGALVAIGLAVPVLAVGSVLAVRRPDPIGVVRQQSPPRPPRRLWWRLLFPVLGGLLLWSLGQAQFGPLPALGAGIVALLVSAAVLLPWVLERLARLLPDGPPAWQLAVGRLRLDPGTPARVVAGLSVVLAGAIALQPLLAAGDRLDREGEVAYQVQLADVPTSEMERVVDLLHDRLGPAADIRGGALVTGTVVAPTNPSAFPSTSPPSPYVDLRLAPCGALGVACTDGMVFAVSDAGRAGPPAGSVVAISVPLTSGDSRSITFNWTVPEPTATISLPDRYEAALVVTPGALGPAVDGLLASSPARFSVTGVQASAEMADTLRADLADLGSAVEIRAAGEPADLGLRSVLSPTARSGLIIGALLTLVVAVVGLIVTAIEQGQQRRRPLTLAVAAGIPRGVLARSMLIGAALPITVGVSLAVPSGWLLVTLLGPMLDIPIALDWATVAVYSAAALGLVTLLAGASTLALPALTRPTDLRTG